MRIAGTNLGIEAMKWARALLVMLCVVVGLRVEAADGPTVGQVDKEASAFDSSGADGGSDEESLLEASAWKDGRSTLDLLNAPGLSRGVDAIIAEIRKRELDLAVREQRAAERERAVAELEARLEQRTRTLDRIRQEVEDRIAAWSEQGPDRVQQMADVYAAMAPERAGRLLDQLDLDLAVSVVRSMKKKSSASVLAAMKPERALLVSRRILSPLDPRTDVPAARAN
jgi:flagellar motility protein MotE (MotC chaperone)